MIVLQILLIPLITLLLLAAIFVLGSSGIERPGQPQGEDRYNVTKDEPEQVHTATPCDFHAMPVTFKPGK